MRFDQPLVQGTLVKRYKRFLVDVQLDNDEITTAHCPNTGTMLSCSDPGSRVCLSRSANSNRKYPLTLEMVKTDSTWIGVNTARTNKLVEEAITNRQIAQFQDVQKIKREVRTSEHTRLDLQVIQEKKSTFIEVKNCSLAVDGCAMFPDAVTARGTKHLQELIRLTAKGLSSCIFFLVQRMDADRFSAARHIDPLYSDTLLQAAEAGVLILVYQAEVNPEGIEIVGSLPCSLV